MGIKKKILGIVAVAALTMSMMGSGTAAQTVITGEANLEPSVCGIVVTSSGGFGTWKYDSALQQYVPTGTSASTKMTLTANLTVPYWGATCKITTTSTGLSYQGSTTAPIEIPVQNFRYSVGSSPEQVGDFTYTSPSAPHGTYVFNIRLNNVDREVDPGNYKGTMTYTVSPG